MTNKLSLKELPVAVQAYFDLKDTHVFSPLMELIQQQTPYMQKRYFNMVDALRIERDAKLDAQEAVA